MAEARPLLYGELVSWYRLLDPPGDHAEEAALFRRAFERGVRGEAKTLLEQAPALATTRCTSRRASPARSPTSPRRCWA